jgi:cell wall assembly regulator SMI1
MSWPDRGPWLVAAVSPDAGWEVVTAALAASSDARTAALVVMGPGYVRSNTTELVRDTVTTYVETASPLRRDDVVRLTRALAHTHDRVLVVATDGLLVPLGEHGWMLADLAGALPAPVVLATGTDPGNTTAVLEALTTCGITAAVVAVGDGAQSAPLPVALAGRIPADAVDRPDQLATEARDWLDPLLREIGKRPATGEQTGTGEPARSIVVGKRVIAAMVAVLVLSVLALCAINALAPDYSTATGVNVSRSSVRAPAAGTEHPSTPARPRPSASSICPLYRGTTVTEPDWATINRVNTAWSRIERWLAVHAPATAESLRPPAPAERIAALQARMSVQFSPDLVASLRRHDGVQQRKSFELPPFYRPLPVDEIFGEWEVNCQVLADMGGGGRGEWWWHPAYVPFAASGDGGCLLVDQRPDRNGRVGEFYPESGTTFTGPRSFVELLEGVAAALESGTPYAGQYRPVVIGGGALDWQILIRTTAA